jgi:hypothetical protein
VGVLVACSSVLLLMRAALRVTSTSDVVYPEGSVVYSVLALVDGRDAFYRDFTRPPYEVTQYTPLYYLLTAGLTRAFGGGVQTAYVCGRLLTLLATVMCLGLAVRLGRRSGVSAAWAAGGVLLTTTLPALSPWAYACRPDLLGLAFSLAGLTCFLARPTPRGRVLACGLFFLALFTKQTFIAAPLAVIASLLRRRAYRSAGQIIAILTLLTGSAFVLMDGMTAGRFFQNIVTANLTPMQWEWMRRFVLQYFVYDGALVLLFALMGVSVWRRRPGPESRTLAQEVLVAYLLTAVAVAIGTSGKLGAGANYFIEPVVAAAMVAGRGLRYWAAAARRFPAISWVLVLILLSPPEGPGRYGRDDVVARTYPEVVSERLRTIPGDVLIENPGLALRVGRRILLLTDFNAAYLSAAGTLSCHLLVRALERGDMAAVLAMHPDVSATYGGQPYWPAEVAQAITRHYRLAERVGTQWLFLPKATMPEPASPEPAGGELPAAP